MFKWKSVYYRYLSKSEKSIEEISQELFRGKSMVYNDIDDALRSLTTLLFGVDGMKLKRG